MDPYQSWKTLSQGKKLQEHSLPPTSTKSIINRQEHHLTKSVF